MIDAPTPAEADFALRINGDSMTPMFTDGQIVYIKKSSELKNGEIGIFYLNGNAYIKKLERKKKNVRLISLNQAYAPINVSTNDSFKIFGRVLSQSHLLPTIYATVPIVAENTYKEVIVMAVTINLKQIRKEQNRNNDNII